MLSHNHIHTKNNGLMRNYSNRWGYDIVKAKAKPKKKRDFEQKRKKQVENMPFGTI